MTTFNNDLIVAGDLTAAGGVSANRIARWDGTVWHAIGGGFNGAVYAVIAFNGELIAGGIFTQADGLSARFIARWDGQNWRPMGDQFNGVVRTLIVHNDQLIAGGDFTEHLAQWNGSAWQPFPNAPSGTVEALTQFNGQLIAGGAFNTAGMVQVNNVARWDGIRWHALQSTTPGSPAGTNDGVKALHVHDGDLYVGGFLQLAGGKLVRGIARWDGADWHALGSGVLSYVFAITSLGDLLVAGGAFLTAGGIDADNVAAWDGEHWIALDVGMSSAVNALRVWNGGLFAGGFFTQAGGDPAATYLAGFDACIFPAGCDADINGSDAVDIADLLAVISQWGPCPAPPQACPANVVAGGATQVVNIDDLLAVISAWGACP